MRVRRRLLISGRVQNVWFRDSARAEAERLGLSGWVRNLDDGRVEMEAEGPGDAVERLIAWARIGPPRATVEDLAVELVPTTGGTGFALRPDGAGQPRA